MEIAPEEMETCLRVLQRIADSHGTIRRDERFNGLVSKGLPGGQARRPAGGAPTAAGGGPRLAGGHGDGADPARRAAPRRRAARALPSEHAAQTLNQPECCYICKQDYTEVHFFYHLLCPKCAAFNYQMRDLRADLTGRTALVTGGRVKIGHQTVLRLLRDGAKVIVTTRFPHAAARRFHAEADSARVGGPAAHLRPGPAQHPGGGVVRAASAGHRAVLWTS